ncbi:acetylglutamate kinase [Vagococcus entomophilus]|uniref:Acetylglutamate kinase n=1 Tax=Vagococcus entomophilus TaxID=1160095 RepID=A0A430AGK0_9ENTE|nr:acetylglutamate kinase [Vagococcus entomophilus]RSU06984.1 acetylglutamate kinase [Vagococcus entomophilus]
MGIIVIKIGGVASHQLSAFFFQQLKNWRQAGKKIVLIHGGGRYVSEMLEKLQIPIQKKDGLRVTTKETLEVTKMVLIGQVQPCITSFLQANQLPAIGLNASDGHLLTGKFLSKETYGLVGKVAAVQTDVLHDLLEKDYIPVIAPLGLLEKTEDQWLNINADAVACEVAAALKAEALYLLTDVPGIQHQNKWLEELSIHQIEGLKQAESLSGGMLPKVESAMQAVLSGVKQVIITNELENQGTRMKGVTAG